MREKWEPLLYPVTFAVALLLRIWQPVAFVAQGELEWAWRAMRFWVGPGAVQSPVGMVTLWVSSLGIGLRRLLEGSASILHWEEMAELAAFDPQNLAQVRLVASFWPTAKFPVAVASALLLTLIAFLVARLWGARAGLLAGLLLTVSPYHLALSRVLGPHALTAGLAVSALLALLWALRRSLAWAPLLLSAVLAGLSILNAGEVAILLPAGLLLLAAGCLAAVVGAREQSARGVAGQGGRAKPGDAAALILPSLLRLALWPAATVATAVLFYPPTWQAPLGGAAAVLGQEQQGLHGLAAPQAIREAGLALGLRMAPLTLVGLALTPLAFLGEENRRRLPLAALVAFAGAFLVLVPWTERESEPWVLTALVALDVAAAVGLDTVPVLVWRLLRRHRERVAPWASLGLSLAALAAIAWQGRAILGWHPYYPAYCNPWLAAPGSRPAGGWGEGLDRAAAYLSAQPQAERIVVATPQVTGLAPLFRGETVPLNEGTLATADYVVLYRRDWLDPDPLCERLRQAMPVQVIRWHGIEYARIYANRVHEPILAAWQGELRPDDVIVVDGPSPLARHYRGAAPLHEIRVQSAEGVAAELTRLTAGRWRLWHVALAGADPQGIVRDLLETQAALIQRREVPGAAVSTYVLPVEPGFHVLVPDQPVGIAFTAGLSLLRSGLAEAQVQYRQKIAVALAWQARDKLPENVAISLRLIDDQGGLWAQQDQWVLDEKGRPSATWAAGETVVTHHTLPVPPAVPPGMYRLRAVFYMADSHQPLAPVDPTRSGAGGVIDLFALDVMPAQVPPTPAELKLAHPLQVPLAEGMELLGYDLGADTVQAGQELSLRLWWRSTHPVTATYQAHVMLLDAAGHLRGEATVDLAGNGRPTTAWVAGEVIEGRYRLGVDPESAAGEGILGVELVGIHGPVGQPVRLATVRVQATRHVFEVPPITNPRQETLDGKVRLLGYDVDPTRLKPGQSLRLTLYWQSLAPMKASYTVFTHLLDAQGEMRAGHDGVPVGGTRPTTGWVLHEVLADYHEIVLPASLAPGRYAIEVGLYDATSGVRLPTYDASAERLAQDRILLGAVIVE